MQGEVVIRQEPTGPEAPAEEIEENTGEVAENTQEGQAEATEVPEDTPEDTPEDAPEGAEDEALDAAEEAGIDVAAAEAHFLEHGEVDEATYERAAKAGITKEMVDEYVQYRVGQADRIREEVLQPYGGEKAVVPMVEWAAENWTQEQAQSFNDAVNSGDRAMIDMALKALAADYGKSKGVKPNLIAGKGTVSKGSTYQSMAQLLKDQADPRYRSDPAFRKEVESKLARSNI